VGLREEPPDEGGGRRDARHRRRQQAFRRGRGEYQIIGVGLIEDSGDPQRVDEACDGEQEGPPDEPGQNDQDAERR
jgi:hypothetical protein